MEEAARIVLPLARATSKNAQAYTEIPAALQAAKAKMQAAAPSPSAQQVNPPAGLMHPSRLPEQAGSVAGT